MVTWQTWLEVMWLLYEVITWLSHDADHHTSITAGLMNWRSMVALHLRVELKLMQQPIPEVWRTVTSIQGSLGEGDIHQPCTVAPSKLSHLTFLLLDSISKWRPGVVYCIDQQSVSKLASVLRRPSLIPRPTLFPRPSLILRPSLIPRPSLVPRPLIPRPSRIPRPSLVPRPSLIPRLLSLCGCENVSDFLATSSNYVYCGIMVKPLSTRSWEQRCCDNVLFAISQQWVGVCPPSSVPTRHPGCTFVCSTYPGVRRRFVAFFLPHWSHAPCTWSPSVASGNSWGKHFLEGDWDSHCQVRKLICFPATLTTCIKWRVASCPGSPTSLGILWGWPEDVATSSIVLILWGWPEDVDTSSIDTSSIVLISDVAMDVLENDQPIPSCLKNREQG